jgi:uncharacterized protein involved in exopolysaccharide biosynthesis
LSQSVSEEKNQTQEHPEKPEVRYVPIEYMPKNMNEGEFDLVDLIMPIWDGRKTILKIVILFAFIGFFVALFSGEEFESEAILLPEVQQAQQGRAGQLLQQFGGAFGLGGGSISNGTTSSLPPMIYPRIVNSLGFQAELLDNELHFGSYDVKTTLPDFFENHYKRPLTVLFIDYTIKLPFTLRSSFSRNNGDLSTPELEDQRLLSFSQREMLLIDNIRDRISVNIDQESGLLNIRSKLPDARASAELNRAVIDILKEYAIEYSIEKSRQDLEFIEEQHESASERFRTAQISLADFRDQNITLSTARAQTELERLQDEKDLAYNVYNSLSQQLEQARLKVQEQTPVFTEIQTANIPTERSEPKRVLLLTMFVFIGAFISIIWVYIASFIKNRILS